MPNIYRGPFVDLVRPFALTHRVVHEGFDDTQIAALMGPSSRRDVGCPWLLWQSETYSLGGLLRALAHWPSWLPIPAVTDHGLASSSVFAPHEIAAAPFPHLTTSPLKAHLLEKPEGLDVRFIPAAWTHWLHEAGITTLDDAQGTLAFIPHTLDAVHLDVAFVQEFVEAAKALPARFQPVVAMVQQHDIRDGVPELVRGCGMPVVTAGSSNHPHYFARWVSIARHFRFAVSSKPGSDLFLFHALGGTYMIHGSAPRYHHDTDVPDETEGAMTAFHRELDDWAQDLRLRHFEGLEGRRTDAQDRYVALFTHAGARMSGWELHRLFLRALRFVPRSYWREWAVFQRARARHALNRARVRAVARLRSGFRSAPEPS